jgi:apolipoprotein N-acyltransferase
LHSVILFFEKIKNNYSHRNVKIGFLGAICFSAFIFLEHFDTSFKIINSLLAIAGLYILLTSNKYSAFVFGFFVGIFWFYWISISFIYYELSFLIPIVVISIGTLSGLMFLPIGIPKNSYAKVALVLLLSFIHPFGFNWLIPSLPFVNSYFGIDIWQFTLILLSIALFINLPKRFKIYSFVLLIPAIEFTNIIDNNNLETFPIKTKIVSTKVAQQTKWQKNLEIPMIYQNISYIDMAIKDGYKLVVLPETVFTVPVNILPSLMGALKEKSKKIAIVAGGLKYKNGLAYNSTYFFKDGFVQIFDKKYLVPFGEQIPLPTFFTTIINDTFFDGAQDFIEAKEPSVFKIGDIEFINAICYEATKEEIHKYGPKYIIATTNNGWFYPSTEPTLQKLIIKYMSKKYNTKVIHSINMSKGYAIGMKI